MHLLNLICSYNIFLYITLKLSNGNTDDVASNNWKLQPQFESQTLKGPTSFPADSSCHLSLYILGFMVKCYSRFEV